MSLHGTQSKQAGSWPARAFAGSVCHCEAYDLGISHPIVVVPENRVSADEYVATHGPCSLDDIEKHWRDYAIEPERLFHFLKSQSETFDSELRAGNWADFHVGVPVSQETSSELAVRAGKKLLCSHPDAASKIAAVIYYSATLSSRPAWSTSCRLHFELGLKCETSFMVGQKGANAVYAALRIAAEMLHVEQLDKILLVGSEAFAPPHSRMFSGFSIQGDSASAMLLARDDYDFRLCCIGLYDFQERPPCAADSVHDALDYWSEAAGTALTHLLEAAGRCREKIALVLPPGCSPELLSRIAGKLRLPWQKFDCGALREIGSLGSSDLVLNLKRISRSGVLSPGDEVIAFGFSSDGGVCGSVLRYEPRRGAQ